MNLQYPLTILTAFLSKDILDVAEKLGEYIRNQPARSYSYYQKQYHESLEQRKHYETT